ncbi:chorismate mutase [Bacillus cereus group sp. RP32]|uniref:chorismate mutase n=1 Tax=Bacillus cereus group sp. RP32 TaxID=3040258 RepID=UPI0033968B15
MSQLNHYRKKIDEIDSELLKILSERFELVRQVGILKKNETIDIMQPNRMQEIFETRKVLGKDLGLDTTFIKPLFDLIIDYSCNIEDEIINVKKENIKIEKNSDYR